MKKILSLLCGCLAALIVSVSFSACNPKDKNNATNEAALIGVWTWNYVAQSLQYTLTIKDDHTGTVVTNETNATFNWSMDGDEIHLVITSGQLPGIQSRNLDMKVTFLPDDKVKFTMTEDPYETFGPFTKTSNGGNNGGNQPSATEARMIGTWTADIQTSFNSVPIVANIMLTIKDDHTGSVLMTMNNHTHVLGSATFDWSMVNDYAVSLTMTSNTMPTMTGLPNPLVLLVSFPQENQISFALASNPETIFGPFTKVAE